MFINIPNSIITTFSCVVLFTNSIFNFQAQLKGTVYDNFLDPIENVTVKVGAKEVKTDYDGNFTIDTEATFPLKIKFTKEGYEEKEVELQKSNDSLEVVLNEL